MPLRQSKLAMSFPTKFDVMGIRYMTAPEAGGQTPPAAPPAPPAPSGDEPLGEGGKRALEAERARATEFETALKAYSKLGSAEDLQKLLQANQDSNADKIRQQATTEAEAAANERLHNKLRSNELRTQAAVLGFNDPNDVAAFLTAEQIKGLSVSDTDEVDGAAAKALLEALAKSKPYLVKDTVTDSRTAGIGSVGSSGGATNVQPGRARIAAAYGNKQ